MYRRLSAIPSSPSLIDVALVTTLGVLLASALFTAFGQVARALGVLL